MTEINHTQHLEFKTEAAAQTFLESKKEKGLQGSIHRIYYGVDCKEEDEGAIKYKTVGDGFREYSFYLKRKPYDLWFVSLWGGKAA